MVKDLKENVGNLKARDAEFAYSLMASAAKKGLSPKQQEWVEKLTDWAVNGYPKADVEHVGMFMGVYKLFFEAAKNLKYPKIRLETEAGDPVALSRAGPTSRFPGMVTVTDGGPYASNKYYGRVDKGGEWTKPYHKPKNIRAIGELLTKLANDPAGTAANYGKLTGNCCFCNRYLEDERSTTVGYGPVCAENFGMPWGEKAVQSTAPRKKFMPV